MLRQAVLCSLAAATMLAAAGVSGCSSSWSPTVTGTQAVAAPFSATGTLAIETANGTVEVRQAPVASLEVDATIRAVSQERLAMTQVVVEPGPDQGVRISVHWPDGRRQGNEGCSLIVRTPGQSGLDVRTSNGRVTIAGLNGPATIRTSNGSVEVGSHDGPVNVDTSNGRIQAERIQGDVSLSSSNGRIEAVDVGGAVRADTSNGAIAVRLSPIGMGPLDLNTSNGSVRVEVGPTFAGVVDASTSNGHVTMVGAGEVVGEKSHRSGRFGTGGGRSVVRTSNGTVEVVRAGE